MGQNLTRYDTPKTYYKDLTKKATMVEENNEKMKTKVQMCVSIENCKSSTEYRFTAEETLGPARNLLGNSEKKYPTDSVVVFDTVFLMPYFFEKEQNLLITIEKNSEKFPFKTTMGTIVGSRGGVFKKKFDETSQEILCISAKEIKDDRVYFTIDFELSSNHGVDLTQSKNWFFYTITKNKAPIYRSEGLSMTGKLRKFSIPNSVLGNDGSFEIAFKNSKGSTIVKILTTIAEFIDLKNGMYKTIFLKLSSQASLVLINKSFSRKDYSFMDYLYSGVQLGLTLGIDFTGSNGNPFDKGTLHELKEGVFNDYQRAIYQCGRIVAPYDYDQMFPVFGFGANLPGTNDANHCFPLNFQSNPEIYTIEGILAEYQKNMPRLVFSGPTYFSPILENVIFQIKQQQNNLKYHILMFLTDGMINDMDRTTDLLVEGSFLPLSVIIIGIGNADFSNMVELDADEKPLISTSGVKSGRDLVQFVPFSKFENNAKKLAEEVLEEIPRQIVEYYTMNNIFPNSINM